MSLDPEVLASAAEEAALDACIAAAEAAATGAAPDLVQQQQDVRTRLLWQCAWWWSMRGMGLA